MRRDENSLREETIYDDSKADDGKTQDRLLTTAVQVRRAFELLRDGWEEFVEERYDLPREMRSSFAPLKNYPTGCCDRAAMLLMRHLHDEGFANARCVFARLRRDRTRQHVWVEVDGTLIDITADQFKRSRPRPAPVIVTKDSQWHRRRYVFHSYMEYTPDWTERTDYSEKARRLIEPMYGVLAAIIGSEASLLTSGQDSPEP
jgi:hypothetical protein